MIETILKNSSHSKDRHVFRARTLLGNAIFDHLTLQKSSVITVDGVQLNGVDHTLPGFCTKEMHYPTESHVARSRMEAPPSSIAATTALGGQAAPTPSAWYIRGTW